MKIISDREYQGLVANSSKTDVSKVEELKKAHQEEIATLKKESGEKDSRNQRLIDNLKEDHKIAMERKVNEQDIVVQKATKTLEDKLQKLTIESEGYKKEKEILTQAFKNLCFDVKDMKEEKCYSCGCKGTYSQMHGIHGAEDFGGDGFDLKPTPQVHPCNACNGTGFKPQPSSVPDPFRGFLESQGFKVIDVTTSQHEASPKVEEWIPNFLKLWDDKEKHIPS